MNIWGRLNIESHKGRPLTPANKMVTTWRPSENFMHCCIESSGCRFNRDCGACVMCDYGIGRNLEPHELKSALDEELRPYEKSLSTILFGTYGSIFDTSEISAECLEVVLQYISNQKFKTVIFETHCSTVSVEILKKIRCFIPRESKKVIIEMGYESCDEFVLKNCLNKVLDLDQLCNAIKLVHEYEMEVCLNVFVGAPFLNENDQLESALKSVIWAFEHDADSVVIFPCNIKPFTLIYDLYQRNLYKPVTHWMLLELLNRIPEQYLNRITLSWYGNRENFYENNEFPLIPPTDCPQCHERIFKFYHLFMKSTSSGERKELLNDIIESEMGCDCHKCFLEKLKNQKERLSENDILKLLYKIEAEKYIENVKKVIKYIFYVAIATGVIALIVLIVWAAIGIFNNKVRLDQYASTILTTTAGVVGTMFGLTAASYAFIWGDLRSDSKENRHLENVLKRYSNSIWKYFVCSLGLTVLVIFSSLLGLAMEQNVTQPTLYITENFGKISASLYQNNKFRVISFVVLINLSMSAVAVLVMVCLNYAIFKRDVRYAQIANKIMSEIKGKYCLEFKDLESKKQSQDNLSGVEYEKVHNLELLVERILKNHESIGEAFSVSQRREKLLETIISNDLKTTYGLGEKADESVAWRYLDSDKRINRMNICHGYAKREYQMLSGIGNVSTKPPTDCGFVTVYDDLLMYRDNSLVYEENNSAEIDVCMRDIRALRYTIKKRLLFYYLKGESFSNMDLSGVSFSGADLRFTNFSGCNLSNIRLKGANCEGTDFTGAKMTGMYFSDIESDEAEKGEIQITCTDDLEKCWNPYKGKEATCFVNATFKEADVSRAYLKMPEKPGQNKFFSLEGTNFDNAKMFNSFFKNIDFTNSSLARAQMFNVGMVQTMAKSANFSNAILTNACIAYSNFENADFMDSALTESIVICSDFKGAKLQNINLSYSNIVSSSFEGASCQNASFKNIIQNLNSIKDKELKALDKVELSEKQTGLRFDYAILTNTDFSGAELNDVSFANAVGQGCIFTQANGKKVIFDNALFTSAVFNTAKFQMGSFSNTVFRNAVILETQFINSHFKNTDFSNALFINNCGSCFMGGYMEGVNFSNAKSISVDCFENIWLRKVDFKGTGIKREDFQISGKGVKLENCLFEGV